MVSSSTNTTDMSSSLLQAYPQMALVPGIGLFGLGGYVFATVAPLWAFAFFGPLIRKLCPDGFTLSEYILRRYGWMLGVFSGLVFIAFMFCFMIVELNTYGAVVSTIVPSLEGQKWIPPLIVAITTFLYTAYGGFKTSLWTDNVNAVIVIVFIIIGACMFGTRLDINKDLMHESELLGANVLGGEMWYVLTISIVFAQMFNQGFWQRAFASRTNKGLWASVLMATLPLYAICFFVGMAGPLALWSGVQQPINDDDDGSLALFRAMLHMPRWVHGIILVLSGVLSCSAYDTFQSAQISVIYSDFFLGKLNIWACRVLLLLINVPCVFLAVYNIDILRVFLIADLAGLAIIPGVFLGLIPGFDVYNAVDVVVGGCGGFLTVFVFGTIYYHGDVQAGGSLIGLPNGVYTTSDDYSIIGAFLCAPVADICFALASCGVRILIGYVFCRITGREFTMLRKRVFNPRDYAVEEDRPVSFFHRIRNEDDGFRLDPKNEENVGPQSWLERKLHSNKSRPFQDHIDKFEATEKEDMESLTGRSRQDDEEKMGGWEHDSTSSNERMHSSSPETLREAVPGPPPMATVAPVSANGTDTTHVPDVIAMPPPKNWQSNNLS